MHGFVGLKPGWTRINFHYLMSDAEFEFIMEAICFVCRYGRYFLPLYSFDIHTGNWRCRDFDGGAIDFGLEHALKVRGKNGVAAAPKIREAGKSEQARKALYAKYLEQARARAEELMASFDSGKLQTTEKDLIPFVYV
jgi:hypothetical protein